MRLTVSIPATPPARRPLAVFDVTDTRFLYSNFTDFILTHRGNNIHHLVHLKESSHYVHIIFMCSVWI